MISGSHRMGGIQAIFQRELLNGDWVDVEILRDAWIDAWLF